MKINNISSIPRGIVLKKSINGRIDTKYLQGLETDSQRYKCLYKRFYKLRYLIDDDKHVVNRYKETIRWRFTKEQFNVKRQRVLELEDTLTQPQLWERMINTLAFVHNSTVALPEHLQQDQPTFYHETIMPQRMEKSIVLTILKMHYKMPSEIKYDTGLEWFSQVKHQLGNLPEVPTKKQMKEVVPQNVGYIDYMLTIMALNESYKLCL